MGEDLASESDLLSVINEYLKFAEFEETVKVFEKEVRRKGKPVLKSAGHSRRHSKTIGIHEDFLSSFNDGDYKVFSELWAKTIPPEIRDFDPVAQKLEFYLQIHFTIYPLKSPVGSHDKGEFDNRITHFKHYRGTEPDHRIPTVLRSAVCAQSHSTPILPGAFPGFLDTRVEGKVGEVSLSDSESFKHTEASDFI
ncbi:lisH domain-containing protein ARMC9-like isoform X2 [Sinocyclocheilus grahami]|nr:PREDICTED: lisH domain-containing protein ARMC9-like isoform X2 [Sinocyclocheilus grahami]